MSADDKVSSGYKYFWSALETQEQELKAFLAKVRVNEDATTTVELMPYSISLL